MHRIILSVTVTLVSLMTAFSVADDRKKIGEIFGEPVYRDQIHSSGETVRNDLHRLFTAPVLERYKRAKRKEIELTKDELTAAVAHDRAGFEERFALNPENEVGQFAELKRQILSFELQLTKEGLDERERRGLERERNKLNAQVDTFVRQFSQWHWSNTKFQRHLYSSCGGGRVLFQQAGLEAFDAMHQWL